MTRNALIATFMLISATVHANAEEAKPAYLVASLQVSDLKAYFEQYGGPVFPMLDKAGAEVLVGTPAVEVLEGDYGSTWTAIVRFPSKSALETWYNSTEYQMIAPKRRVLSDASTSTLFIAPAFEMPPQ